MKIIKRPDSETWVGEILFHRIKNNVELQNVLLGVKIEQIIPIMKLIDSGSFTPLIGFAIKRKEMLLDIGNEMYIVERHLIGEMLGDSSRIFGGIFS